MEEAICQVYVQSVNSPTPVYSSQSNSSAHQGGHGLGDTYRHCGEARRMHSAERGSVGLVLGDSFGGGSRIDRGARCFGSGR